MLKIVAFQWLLSLKFHAKLHRPVLTARSCWKFKRKTECPTDPVCLTDIHVTCLPAIANPSNVTRVQPSSPIIYQHNQDIQIVVKTFMERTRKKLPMSDAETSWFSNIKFKIRHGLMGSWVLFRELPAVMVLVMTFFFNSTALPWTTPSLWHKTHLHRWD